MGRRRRWSVATKGRIVAESYAPGAVVSEVARRHDMSPQHLFGWRKAARAGLLTLPADEVPMFVPIVREARDDGVAAAVGVTVSGVITIGIAGAVVRAERGVDLGWLRDVLRAVKAAT
ncbi:MAG TPA: transposase [Vicinamibacterales bacterium]